MSGLGSPVTISNGGGNMNMEQIAGLIITGILFVPGIIFGIILCSGRGIDMIAGFNTSTPEERAKWDEKALCRGVGILLFMILGCMTVIAVASVLGMTTLVWGGLFLTALIAAGGMIYINKSKRFKKK